MIGYADEILAAPSKAAYELLCACRRAQVASCQPIIAIRSTVY
jgi:hypothetical protein